MAQTTVSSASKVKISQTEQQQQRNKKKLLATIIHQLTVSHARYVSRIFFI